MSTGILGTAIFSLSLGLLLYLWQIRSGGRHFSSIQLLSWFLFALFPVLILFSVFPSSNITIAIKGISMGGAFAAFYLIWRKGYLSAIMAVETDNLRTQIKKLTESDRRLPPSQFFKYGIKGADKQIVLVTGGIEHVKVADIWVNSENTNMQMARFYDSSISGTIRYCGALRDDKGNVLKDNIAKELSEIMDGQLSVEPGIVLATKPGELNNTNNVKRVFHTASVRGQVGIGYIPIQNIEICVINSLKLADSAKYRNEGLSSILFPLFGTGTAAGDLETTAEKLISTAITYLEQNADSSIKCVYFLVWSEKQLRVCKNILESVNMIKKIDISI